MKAVSWAITFFIALIIAGCGGAVDEGATTALHSESRTADTTRGPAAAPQRALAQSSMSTTSAGEDSIDGRVFRLYQAAFDRRPDSGGQSHWVAQMKNGMTLEQVASGFMNSEEFRLLYGANPSTEQFVTLLYKNVLHRSPDPGGFEHWTNALNSRALSREQTLVGFSESAENKSSKLFFGDSYNGAIGSLINPTPTAGTITVDRVITGLRTTASTSSTTISDLAIHPKNDRLYVAHGSEILIYGPAATASGRVSPLRRFHVSGGNQVTAIQLDVQNDALYLAESAHGIEVYSPASELVERSYASTTYRGITINDTSLPSSRTFDYANYYGLAVDSTRNIAYVLADWFNSAGILVFDNIKSIKGYVTPNRVVELHNYRSMFTRGSLFIDTANDRLYVGTSGGAILVFNNASTKSGAISEDKRILLPYGTDAKIKVDIVNDRLYAATGSKAYLINNVSAANGQIPALEASAPNNGRLTAVALRP